MVQEFNVLSCFSCRTFQVDQVKKSTNKWTCKLCGEKQSIKQIFFKGSGKECRMQVQQLNLAKGMKNQVKNANAHYVGDENEQTQIHDHLENEPSQYPMLEQNIPLNEFEKESKPLSNRWEQFVEVQDAHSDNEEDEHGLINVTTERSCFEKSRKMMKRQKHHSQRDDKGKPYQQRSSPQQDIYDRNNFENRSATGISKYSGAHVAGKEISRGPVNMNKERWSIDDGATNLQKIHDVGNQRKEVSKILVGSTQTNGKERTEIDLIPRTEQSSKWDQFVSAPFKEDCSDSEEDLY